LLEAARGGDDSALEALLERQEARIYRFGLQMCRDPEDARDVLQETLLAMARGLRDFRGASSLSTWLYTIARSHCIKKRRKSKFAPAALASLDAGSPESETLPDTSRSPDEALEQHELQAAVREAIQGLAPEYREVLLLRDAEGLRAAEVAEVLGITAQAVKSRLHRARLAVRERVAPLLAPDAGARSGPTTCPDVLALFSQHLEGDIGPELCADMERHVEGCERCRSRCESLRQTLALCRTARAEEVPPAVQESVRAAVRALGTDEA
jgi:RNA polymerase sigma-70 factor (ECF subfamily)